VAGSNFGYALVPAVPPAGSATPVLRQGSNIIAVHVTQTLGGQFVDVGIVRERR